MSDVMTSAGSASPSASEAGDRHDDVFGDFRLLYDEHFAFVWRCVARMGVDAATQEDIVQEVWLRVHRRLPTLRSRASVRAWLFGIARRVVALHRRSKQRHDRRTAALVPLHPREQPSAAGSFEAKRTIEEVLTGLSEDQRLVLMLACGEGMTAPEIAEATGVPLNTVYSRLRLARGHLDAAVAATTEPAPEEEASKRCWAVLVATLPSLGEGPAYPTGGYGKLQLAMVAAVAGVLGWVGATMSRPEDVQSRVRDEVVVSDLDDEASRRVEPSVPYVSASRTLTGHEGDGDRTRARVRQPSSTVAAHPRAKSRSTNLTQAETDDEPVVSQPIVVTNAALGDDGTLAMGSSTKQTAAIDPEDSSLAEEIRLLQPALAALRDEAPERALEHVERHDARFPEGLLADVRTATKVRALCRLERPFEAREVGETFLARGVEAPAVQLAISECE